MTQRNGNQVRVTIQDDPIFREFNFSRLVLDEVEDSDEQVILDLSLISTLHSPGLANLVAIHVNLVKRGKKLILTHINEHNRRLLRATNLDHLFQIA
jgi:anti-anti-sigma factor